MLPYSLPAIQGILRYRATVPVASLVHLSRSLLSLIQTHSSAKQTLFYLGAHNHHSLSSLPLSATAPTRDGLTWVAVTEEAEFTSISNNSDSDSEDQRPLFNVSVPQSSLSLSWCVPHKLSRHTSRTRTQEGEGRNKPTASPSYHGRRGATRGKTPTASPGTAGQPHQVTQNHQSGPTPPRTGNRLDSTSAKGVQATRVTIVTEHTRLTIATDTGSPPMPHFVCRFHLHAFPSVPFSFLRGPFPPRRCTSVLVFSAHHLEDGRDGDLIGLAIPVECRGFPFTCCQGDAYT